MNELKRKFFQRIERRLKSIVILMEIKELWYSNNTKIWIFCNLKYTTNREGKYN